MARTEVVVCGNMAWHIQYPETFSERDLPIHERFILAQSERIAALEAENVRLQAKIDALMLEYCPDEMTPEQLANWERHQSVAMKGE